MNSMKKSTKTKTTAPVVVEQSNYIGAQIDLLVAADVDPVVDAETTLTVELAFEELPAPEAEIIIDMTDPVIEPIIDPVTALVEKIMNTKSKSKKAKTTPIVETYPIIIEAVVVEPIVETIVEPIVETPPVAVVIVAPTMLAVVEAIRGLGITDNKSVIDIAETSGLIGKTMAASNPDGRFFQKSYGDKARKQHLKNYAPSYALETFVEIGLAYHAYKTTITETNKTAWKAYANPISYALLGMAVLTGREPAMSTGVYTACGKSFGKHLTESWALWFFANETCFASQIKPEPVVVEPIVETPIVETPVVGPVINAELAAIDAELQATILSQVA